VSENLNPEVLSLWKIIFIRETFASLKTLSSEPSLLRRKMKLQLRCLRAEVRNPELARAAVRDSAGASGEVDLARAGLIFMMKCGVLKLI
jgi:hypothetical protein